MKNAVTLTLLCVLTISAAARAADRPRLVGGKEVMKIDEEDNAYGAKWGINAMRLSPDGRRVLYLRKKMYKTVSADGKQGERRGYKLYLRDLKTGKDTAVPVPALFDDDFAEAWLPMTVFDPAGKTLIVPAGQDANKNGLMEKTERCKVGLYDIASGKLKTLDVEGNVTFPTFHPDGKTLVVMAMEGAGNPSKVKICITPTDKIKFRTIDNPGLPRSISPTSGLMVLLLLTEGERPRPGRCVLYDMKTDTIKTELADQDQSRRIMKNNPQWTNDGRYVYHIMVKNEQRDGRNHRETLTRIWDVKAGQEVGILSGVAPVGPGPGKGTMVLLRLPSRGGSKAEPRIVLHAQDDKTLGQKLHPLGDASTYPITTRGKWLLYRPEDAKGNRAVCLAEIALPKK
ncbi:MAG: hypothetical protein QGH60_13430 [Phycisphaerae bacterium]|jgi:hypothetical protein|nr:hypothetical protein [Phycisphaerae bacterium]